MSFILEMPCRQHRFSLPGALSFLLLPCPSVSSALTQGSGRMEWTRSTFEDMRFGSLRGGMLRTEGLWAPHSYFETVLHCGRSQS